MSHTPQKRCKKCGTSYPETREFFGQYKNVRYGITSIGFRNTCRRCMAEHTRDYDADNPVSVANRAARRRKRTGGDDIPSDLPSLRFLLDDKCRYCSADLNGAGHVDHLTPVARGGTSRKANLTLCCAACNLAKTSKTLDEFMEWRAERDLPTRNLTVPSEDPDPVTRDALRDRFR